MFFTDHRLGVEAIMPTKSEYYSRKARGMCVECATMVAADGHTRCEQCLIKHHRVKGEKQPRQRKKRHQDPEIYAWRKEHGLCARCGTEEPEKGDILCWRCRLAKRDERSVEYVRRVDNGLCVSCGKPRDREGVICEACRLKRQTARISKKTRGENGRQD